MFFSRKQRFSESFPVDNHQMLALSTRVSTFARFSMVRILCTSMHFAIRCQLAVCAENYTKNHWAIPGSENGFSTIAFIGFALLSRYRRAMGWSVRQSSPPLRPLLHCFCAFWQLNWPQWATNATYCSPFTTFLDWLSPCLTVSWVWLLHQGLKMKQMEILTLWQAFSG